MPPPADRLIAVLLPLALGLSGCAPRRPIVAPPPPPAVAPDRQTELDAIVALLDQGRAVAASPRIDALLARDPADRSARMLRQSIDQDPVALLGPAGFAYTSRPGETMTALAQRFLGNPLKAYALARYNHLAVPAALAAGTVLRIPGTPPRAEPVRPAPRPRIAKPRESTPKADPIAARQAREAALVALGQGRVAVAVDLLRRAAALDPDDPLIRRDLARARQLAGAR